MNELVRVRNLNVMAHDRSGAPVPIVEAIEFSIAAGEVLALIGESGSGKTTIALALLGYSRRGCRIASGSIHIGGTDVLSLSRSELMRLRGRKVAYVAQSAAASFNPSQTLMQQVIEAALLHGVLTRTEAQAKAVDLFRSLALPDPEHIGERYPHQVSGGQLQRSMAAMALMTDPELVILDEPTTALDVTTQVEVLRAFKKVVKERGATAVYVSHDLAVVAQMADRILVLNRGEVRECGATEQVLNAPRDSYTRTLMDAAKPVIRESIHPTRTQPPLLQIDGLYAGYGPADAQGLPRNLVLNNVSLKMQRGASLGVIGESGSGKSTLARVIAGLVAPARGGVSFNGEALPAHCSERTRDQFRRIQIVFQNADTALNPAHTVARILGRPLELFHEQRGTQRRTRIAQLLDLVRLPAALAERRCGELSGGQKQRISLARALAAEPDLILCDEVTSALDTVLGAAVLDLMADLQRELKVSYLFISHDINTVRAVCDDILVLYAGQKVEAGTRSALLGPPFHPYTNLLNASVPQLRRGWLESMGPAAALPPLGSHAHAAGTAQLCRFLERCPVRVDGVCNVAPPPHDLARDKEILCHRSDAELRQLLAHAAAIEATR